MNTLCRLRRFHNALWVFLLATQLGLACDARPVLETLIQPENNATECGAIVDGVARPMDTIVMRLMRARSPNCGNCKSEGDCVLEQSQCACGPPVEVNIDNLLAMARPIRFKDVELQESYCLQLATIESGEKRTGEPRVCACKPEWFAPQRFSSWGRICGMSAASAGASTIKPQVNCLSNERGLSINSCFGP